MILAYSPRLSAPSQSNRYYGSDNVFYQSGYGMPNCTAYAWGRFYEISGSRPKLCTGNAGTWYSYTSDGYSRGRSPKLGAVIVWTRLGQAGHVAIVEQINSDGSIVTSNSAWGGTYFYTQTLYPPSYTWSSYYQFQGFIYNPAVSGSSVSTSVDNKLADFLKEVNSHVGEDGSWTWRTSGLSRGQPWCAAFVVACAKSVGILNKVIPLTYVAGDIARLGVRQNMGTFIKGPYLGHSATPQPGDCISFYSGSSKKSDDYLASHIGVVTEVKGDLVYSVEGNSTTWDNYTSKVGKHAYNRNSSIINGYYRPNWSAVGGSVTGLTTSGLTGSLYDMVNTREDATIREVGYVDSKNKPSIEISNTRLSVINYTTFLGSLFSVSDESNEYGDIDVDFSGIGNNNARIIGEYLVDKGLNAAMAVGFLANIYHESGYDTSAVNSDSGASGICQWLGGRKSAMIKQAGSNWRTNLTGQLDYLWSELTGSESNTLNSLKSNVTENTEAMAVAAADIVLRQFERPGNYSVNTPIRAKTAKNIWSKIVINNSSSTTGVNTGNAVADQVWNYLTNGRFSDVVAAGILGNMMRECAGDTFNLQWNIYGSYAGDTYYGLCQWNLRYAPSIRGASISKQLDYLMGTIEREFRTFGFNYASGFNYTKFKRLTSCSEAAAAFAACYERCGYENNYQQRRKNAQAAYDKYHKG